MAVMKWRLAPPKLRVPTAGVLIVALALASGACAARAGGVGSGVGSGNVPRPFPGAALPPGAAEAEATKPDPAEAGHYVTPVPLVELVSTALGFRGVPYRNGGSDPSGFDCSGFVQYVFARVGTLLPREVRDQVRAGREVDRDEVAAGDLLFFETVSRGASHVGLAIAPGQFVHAPSSRGVVRVERYDGSYWASRFVGARRVAEVTERESADGTYPGEIRASRDRLP